MNNRNIFLVVLCIFIVVWSHNLYNREFNHEYMENGNDMGTQLVYDTITINSYDEDKIIFDVNNLMAKIIIDDLTIISNIKPKIEDINTLIDPTASGMSDSPNIIINIDSTTDAYIQSRLRNKIMGDSFGKLSYGIVSYYVDFIKNNYTTVVYDELVNNAIVRKGISPNFEIIVSRAVGRYFDTYYIRSCIDTIANKINQSGKRAIKSYYALSILTQCLSSTSLAAKITRGVFEWIGIPKSEAIKKPKLNDSKDIIPASESSCMAYKPSICKDIIPASELSCIDYKPSVCKDIIPASELSCIDYKSSVCKDIIPASELSCIDYKSSVCKDIIPANVNTCGKYESEICKVPMFGRIFDKSGYFIGPIAILAIILFFIMAVYGLFKSCRCNKSHNEDSE